MGVGRRRVADWEFASRDRVPSGALGTLVLGAVTFFGHGKSARWPVRGSADWELAIEEGLAGWELARREGMSDLALTNAERSIGRELTRTHDDMMKHPGSHQLSGIHL